MLSRQILNLSILALFVAMAIFGLHASMMAGGNGSMSNCPLTNGISSICPMNVFEHIGTWQSLFTAIAPTAILLFLAFALLLGGFRFENSGAVNSRKNRFLIYQRQNFTFRLFDYLSIIFRKGILHPKVFALTSISR